MVIISLEITGVDGYKIANIVKKNNPNVLVVLHVENTKNIQRAVELGAFRYLCNPISKEKLYSCLDDPLEMVNDKCFVVNNNDDEKVVIKLKDIMYIEAGTKGAVIRNTNAMYYSKNSLAKWEVCVTNYPFFRCHKSYIVNLSHVERICKEHAEIYNGERVMISRRRKKEFEFCFEKYIRDLNIIGK